MSVDIEMELPHSPVFVAPEARIPSPAEVMPELFADPDFVDRPVDLICELVDCFDELMAVQLWCWAHVQLRKEKRQLIVSLAAVVRRLGAAA